MPGFSYVPWDNLAAIKAATNEKTVAIMVEPIQGEGGVNMPSPVYLQGLRDWCNENRLLLIFDEVQTGIGRTGSLFAYQQEGVEPDIMTLAKGLAGGLPIGALMATEEIASHLIKGDHGSTFGGNALACAAGYATVKYVIEHDLSAQAARASDLLVSRLRSMEDRLEVVNEVRGRGLLLAVGLTRDCSGDVVDACRRRGLLVNNVRPNAIRLMPPLNVSDEEIDRACDILEEAIKEATTTVAK
jgi:acetylornithine/succinyldiaminopimelate/putrescine aminotransferase